MATARCRAFNAQFYGETVTLAVVSAIDGNRLAWMTAGPVVTPVTGTLTLFVKARILTVAGTVAEPELLDTLIVTPPAGARVLRVRVNESVAVPTIARLVGEKLSDPTTFTAWLTDA